MAKRRLLFDTNMLVYAHDELSPLHEPSAALLDLAIEREVSGFLAEQNLMELYRIVTSAVAMRGRPLSSLEAALSSCRCSGWFVWCRPWDVAVFAPCRQ